MAFQKLTLLLIVLLLSFASLYSTVLWEETFDSNNGWTLENNWSIATGALLLSYTPTVVDYNLSALSPVINVPANATELIVNQYFQDYSTDTGEVMEIDIISGTNENTIWSWDTNVNNNWGISTGQDLALPLSSYAGQTIRIRFKSYGSSTYNFDNWNIFNISITNNLTNDLAITNFSGPDTGAQSTLLNYVVTVQNNGSNPQANFTINLMSSLSDTPLASVNGSSIFSGESIDYTIPWTPQIPGDYTLYSKIIFNADQNPSNNISQNIIVSIEVLTEISINIGTDTSNLQNAIPIDFYYKNSLSQSVYLANEFPNPGYITELKYRLSCIGDIPNGRPIKIWMANTNIENFLTNDSWLPYDQFSLVFDGTVSPGGAGDVDLVFPLTNNFHYLGNNLVIMIQRPMETVYYDQSNVFYCSTLDNQYRSIYKYSDTITLNPMAPVTGTRLQMVPNTTIHLNFENNTSLSGIVSSNGVPIENALIQIQNTNYSTLTDQSGFYSLTDLQQGTYSILCSKQGFQNNTQNNITINFNQTSTLNFALQPIPTITITGSVVANDTNLPVTASISLEGYENYQTTCNAQGVFTIPAVYVYNTYNLHVSYSGYQNYVTTINVVNANLTIPQITLNENTNSPRNVLASVITGNYVNLIWNKPTNIAQVNQSTNSRSQNFHNQVLKDIETPSTRSLGGYKIYRTLTTDVGTPANWTYVGNTSTANDTTFSDYYWDQVFTGSYKYIVKAVYSNNILSDPAFSNTLNAVFIPLHFTKVWTGNGLQHMNFYVTTATINDVALGQNDEIAVFDGIYCVGVKRLNLPISDYVSFVVSLDDPTTPEIDGYTPGNPISFKLFKSSTNMEFAGLAVNTYYINGNNTFSIGTSTTVNISAYSFSSQSISLTNGWNIMSANTMPLNLDISSVFAPLVNANTLIKVQNEQGYAYEFIPYINSWINNIGNLSTTEGYYVKVANSTQFSINGYPFGLPHAIPLTTGWNLINFPYHQAKQALPLLQTLIDNGQLVKVMDQAGNSIENLPVIGWVNNIGSFAPGKGYAVKVNANVILNFNQSRSDEYNLLQVSSKVKLQTPTHFLKNWSGSGWKHFNLFILKNDILNNYLSENDEIAVFDGDLCVGSSVIQQQNENYFVVNASLDDNTTDLIDGYTPDHNFSIKIWKNDTNTEINNIAFHSLNNQNHFEIGASSLIQISQILSNSDSINPIETSINSVYPNPFNPITNINYSINKTGKVNLTVYNIKGQLIKTLVSGINNPGNYKITWNGKDQNDKSVGSGVYFIRLNTCDKQTIKKVIMIK